MKKILSLCVCALFGAALLSSCAPKPEKTIENLKAAATGEANASAKYAKFAEKATEEGLAHIAKLFETTSKAEAIHLDNHLGELKKMGVEFTPIIEDFVIDTTLANLYTAKAGEEHEANAMYPEFIEVAQAEKSKGAEISFDWALKAEVRHANLYQAAINELEGGEPMQIGWVVCKKCGDTYRITEFGEACELCGNTASNFFRFE